MILLSYQSEKRLEHAVQEIATSLEEAGIPFEIVIIDDGSTDGSYALARKMSAGHPGIRAFRLAKNYTSPMAQFASAGE